jgi:hypothetical protein
MITEKEKYPIAVMIALKFNKHCCQSAEPSIEIYILGPWFSEVFFLKFLRIG